MKKILSVIIMIATIVSLASCGAGYEPVKSTDEEARTVITLKYENCEYDVKYELYRALFLSHCAELDGGDRSVWSAEGKDELIAKMNEYIISSAARIYGTLHLADSLGIDPYSSEFDKAVDDSVKDGINSAGSYEKYLAMLHKMNLNYSVQELMIRYSTALEKLDEYYNGVHDDALGNVGGKIEVTKEKVEEYYFGDDCTRVISVYLQANAFTKERAEHIRAEIATKSSASEVSSYAIQYTTSSYEDVMDGVVVGRYGSNDAYDTYTAAAFSLNSGDVSELIEINTGYDHGYYILYGIDKSETHFDKQYDLIKDSYVSNESGKKLNAPVGALKESAVLAPAYYEIVHAAITMD